MSNPEKFDASRQVFLTAWLAALSNLTEAQAIAEIRVTLNAMQQIAWLEGRPHA
jgi:hypothetical protein